MNRLLSKIEEDYIRAIKEQDQLAVSALRLLKSATGNAKISKGEELNDEEIINTIRKEIKNRNESIIYLERAGEADNVAAEKQSIELLRRYLPPEFSESEIESIIDRSITQAGSTSIADFGKIMGLAMQELKGKADASKVSTILRSKIS